MKLRRSVTLNSPGLLRFTAYKEIIKLRQEVKELKQKLYGKNIN